MFNKNSIVFFISFLFFGSLSFWACEKDGQSEVNISHQDQQKSHKEGDNCMNCHKEGGNGEGWFNVAGTVFDSLKTKPLANAMVKLYTGPNGTGSLKYSIEVDGNGNFFTTEAIDFGSGLYPVVEGDKISNYMQTKIVVGRCNECHSQTANRIWVK